MPLIKVRTRAIGSQVVGINEVGVVAVRGVIDRVTPCVGEGQGQTSDRLAQRGLQRVINRIRRQLHALDISKTEEWAIRVRIVTTGYRQVYCCLTRYRHSIH